MFPIQKAKLFFPPQRDLEPCKLNFLHTSVMSVPINKYVCFPKSAARDKVGCPYSVYRGSKVLFAIQTGHSIRQVKTMFVGA